MADDDGGGCQGHARLGSGLQWGRTREGGERDSRDSRVVMMAVVVEDGGGRGRWQRRTTIAAEDNGMQDRAADYNGEGKEWMAKEGGDNGVAMMAAAAEGDGGGR